MTQVNYPKHPCLLLFIHHGTEYGRKNNPTSGWLVQPDCCLCRNISFTTKEAKNCYLSQMNFTIFNIFLKNVILKVIKNKINTKNTHLAFTQNPLQLMPNLMCSFFSLHSTFSPAASPPFLPLPLFSILFPSICFFSETMRVSYVYHDLKNGSVSYIGLGHSLSTSVRFNTEKSFSVQSNHPFPNVAS